MAQQDSLKSSNPQAPSNVPQPAALPDEVMYKNRLQEVAQKSGLALPVYQTVNLGLGHSPQFKSTVFVNGEYYTSPNTFTHRKAAEQDVAKFAYFTLTQRLKNEAIPLIHEDTMFCKSTLIEYAIKMNMPKPSYTTVQQQAVIPVFYSTVNFNGVPYTGEVAKNKKEAEQLAARAAVLSIIDTEAGIAMRQIIKSKSKLYNTMNPAKTSLTNEYDTMLAGSQMGSVPPLDKEKDNDVQAATDNSNNNMPVTAVQAPSLGQPTNLPASYPQTCEYRNPNPNPNPPVSNEVSVTPGIVFVPPAADPTLIPGPSVGKKRNKNKKKNAQKKMRVDPQVPVAVVPLNQVPHCSVAQ